MSSLEGKVQARKMVLASLFVVTLVSVYRDRTGASAGGQQGTFRVLWGVGVVGMFLSLLADFLPQIAGPFAGLVALGSLTHGGDKVIQNVLGTITPQDAASPRSTGSGSPPGPSSSPSSTRPAGNTSAPASAPSVHPVP